MKKIGILTFHNANNYGAVLQAYALKSVLINMGHTVHILNYYCPKLQKEYKGIPVLKKGLKELIKYPFKLLCFPILRARIATQFKAFREQYLLDTPPLTSNTIAKHTVSYDAFFCGSDQVFNPRITNFDSNYFLSFSSDKSKNYSYAASFGLSLENLSNRETQFLSTHLARFNRISVREKQGTKIVKALSAQEPSVHIDPTLLLTKKQWQTMAVAPKQSKYVLLYLMYTDPALVRFAAQFAREKGCSLLYISHSMRFGKKLPATYVKPTVQEWLGLFEHASYVVTTSFHGLAFSINLNKPFVVQRAEGGNLNSRLDNLLTITGLQNRLYTPSTPISLFDEPIDWEHVNKVLDEQRAISISYLRGVTEC